MKISVSQTKKKEKKRGRSFMGHIVIFYDFGRGIAILCSLLKNIFIDYGL